MTSCSLGNVCQLVNYHNCFFYFQIAGALYNQRLVKGESDHQRLTTAYLAPLNERNKNLISAVRFVYYDKNYNLV